MTREEIKNTPELVDFMLDKSVLADSRIKVRKRLEEVCNLAIKALEQESKTWSLDDAKEDFIYDVYNTLDFLPTNDEANRIIDSFDRVTSGLVKQPTIQDKQAESEKYQKAFDDGYANGYAQAKFDYEQDPCEKCNYVEGSPFCLKYCPYDTERKEQEPCDDAVSRKAVLKKIDYEVEHYCKYLERVDDKRNAQTHVALVSDNIRKEVEQLPSVTRQMGEWIRWYEVVEHEKSTEHIPHCKCSVCNREQDPHSAKFINFCPNCGCRMVEPQESEDKK